MYQLSSKAQFISLKSRNLILECNAGFEVTAFTGPTSYLSTSLLTLAGERAAQVLLTISPDFDKIRSQGTVVTGVPR